MRDEEAAESERRACMCREVQTSKSGSQPYTARGMHQQTASDMWTPRARARRPRLRESLRDGRA